MHPKGCRIKETNSLSLLGQFLLQDDALAVAVDRPDLDFAAEKGGEVKTNPAQLDLLF